MIRRLAAAAAVVVVTASCNMLVARYRVVGRPGPGPHVLAIGDSNLAYAGPALQRTLGRRASLTIDAQPGITTFDPRWTSWLRADVAASRPSVVVVQLGTNDAAALWGHQFPAALDRVMRALPAGVPVLWCNVRVLQGLSTAGVVSEFAVDVALRQATARWRNLRVLDYQAHFFGHPEWAPPSAVHLTPAGRLEYARWITAAVTRFTG